MTNSEHELEFTFAKNWQQNTAQNVRTTAEKLACHGVYCLESNNLRCQDVCLGKQLLQMPRIVVTKHVLWNSTVTDTLNHWRVVPRVGKYLTFFNAHNKYSTLFWRSSATLRQCLTDELISQVMQLLDVTLHHILRPQFNTTSHDLWLNHTYLTDFHHRINLF